MAVSAAVEAEPAQLARPEQSAVLSVGQMAAVVSSSSSAAAAERAAAERAAVVATAEAMIDRAAAERAAAERATPAESAPSERAAPPLNLLYQFLQEAQVDPHLIREAIRRGLRPEDAMEFCLAGGVAVAASSSNALAGSSSEPTAAAKEESTSSDSDDEDNTPISQRNKKLAKGGRSAKEKKQARVHTQTAAAVVSRSSKRPRTAPMDPVQCALHEVLMALCGDRALVLEAFEMNLEGVAAVRFCEDKDYRTDQRASHSAAKRAALGLRLPDV